MGFLDKVQETIKTATDQTKTKAQEAQFKRERNARLKDLGEQVYGLFLAGNPVDEQIASVCREIAEIDRKIADAESQSQAARPGPGGSCGISESGETPQSSGETSGQDVPPPPPPSCA
ncbi:MAG: hypothetical protein PHP64_00725 [Actinomycetota bacterium]|nr:hypothetical protein [Actinomycetota bacterium]